MTDDESSPIIDTFPLLAVRWFAQNRTVMLAYRPYPTSATVVLETHFIRNVVDDVDYSLIVKPEENRIIVAKMDDEIPELKKRPLEIFLTHPNLNDITRDFIAGADGLAHKAFITKFKSLYLYENGLYDMPHDNLKFG